MNKLNEKQEMALRHLSAAFEQAGKLGLCFVGMESDLLAFDYGALLQAGYQFEPLSAMRHLGQGAMVETHASYLDSGGW